MSEAPAERARRFVGLHVLADDDPRWPIDPVAQGEAACRGGAAVVQLRAKHATDRETLAWARALRSITRDHGVAFVVNDRFDLALLAEADGVHLGQEDLPPGRIPAEARERLAVGRSTHTLEQARAALAEPIDYLAFGPVFGTKSKESEYSSRGVEMLGRIADLTTGRPLVAIGGIDVGNIERTLASGASGAAVISAVAAAEDPTAAVRALVSAFVAASGGSPTLG